MTTTQPSIFDAPAAIAARDDAIDRADTYADDAWKRAAIASLRRVAQRTELFIVDELWAEMEAAHPGLTTHEPRALGAVMLAAQKRGWIEQTDSYAPSSRPSCHRNPRKVWRSKIVERKET